LLHIAAMKQRKGEGDPAVRWKWFTWLADLLLLRCGRTLGVSLALHIEAAAWAWFYYTVSLPFVSGSLPNLFVFHGMEEVEHGALTVQQLRKQTSIFLSLLTFPIVVVVHVVLLLSPPVSALILRPGLLLNPRIYVDLFNYYMAFGVGFLMSTYGQIMYCLLPLQESQTMYTKMHKYFLEEIKARGIKFDVIAQETYTLR